MLFKSKEHPLSRLTDFHLIKIDKRGFRYLTDRYSIEQIKKADPIIKEHLEQCFSVEVLMPRSLGSSSSRYPTYVISDPCCESKTKVVVKSTKSLLSDGIISILSERAVLHAVNEIGGYYDALSEESNGRLRGLTTGNNADINKNLENVYEKIRSLATQALTASKVAFGSGVMPTSSTAKIDVLTANANIHVKYNDTRRVIGLQDVKSNHEFLNGNLSENQFGNSTSLFRKLRNEYVETLKVPNGNETFGQLTQGKHYVRAIDVMSELNLETNLLYKNESIRKEFIDHLTKNGYVESLKKDVENFLFDASKISNGNVATKDTYFFVFTGKRVKSGQAVDVDSINLCVKQFQLKDSSLDTDSAKSVVEITEQHESINSFLFNVLIDKIKIMTVEFRAARTGHPPQLHFITGRIPEEILKVTKYSGEAERVTYFQEER